jgi:hypothetical protein
VAGEIDRYIHLLLRERLGNPAPDLSVGILESIDAEQRAATPLRSAFVPPPARSFRPWMAVAASIAVVAAVTLGVSAYLVSRDKPVSSTTAGDNTVRVIPSEQERANQQSPDPQPEKQPSRPQPKPEPKAHEQVEKPQPLPEPEPQPEPQPPKPEDDPVVGKPKQPEPEPQPEPQPPKPDDGSSVDKPEPEPEPEPQRPPTEAEPPRPAKLGTVLYTADKARLEFRMGAEEKWQDWVEGGDVLAGMQFQTRRPAGIMLPDGARFYFNGEITVGGDDKTVDVTIEDDSVYFDVYGSKRQFTVRRGESVLIFRDAEVLAEKSGVKLHVACLGGELTAGEVTLKAGWTASLSDDGFSREKFEGERARRNDLVEEMDGEFFLRRDELNADSEKRVYCGELKDGVISGGGNKECSMGIELADELTITERGYLRMRLRVHGSKDGFSIGFGSGKGSEWKYFQTGIERIANEEWVIVRIPLSQLRDDGTKKNIWPGVVLHKMQIVLWTKEGSSVELDWYEFGVDPEWNIKEKK